MSELGFSRAEKDILVENIQEYFEHTLDQQIGQFDAEFLLDFFTEQAGAFFYNQGLKDAQAVLESRVDSITDAIYEIEKATPFRR